MDVGSFSGLNVTQLKSKCKELKISGYSRLSKAALIEKLVNTTSSKQAIQEETHPSITPQAPTELSAQTHGGNHGGEQDGSPPTVALDELEPTKKTAKKRTKKDNDGAVPPPKKAKKALASPLATVGLQQGRRRVGSNAVLVVPMGGFSEPQGVFQAPLLPVRLSGVASPSVPSNLSSTNQSTLASPSQRTQFQETSPCAILNVTPIGSTSLPRLHEPLPNQPANTAPGRRIENNKANPTCSPQEYKPKAFKAPAVIKAPRTVALPRKPQPLQPPPCPPTEQSLDFPTPCAIPTFSRITMPPSMARRRQAERMSVVFSGIKDPGIFAACVLVSRAWRYAVYLSATHALVREFPGMRTSTVLSTIREPRMTNTWSYLRARRQEVEDRHSAFKQSWLGRFMERTNMIALSSRMWTSPDDPCQLTLVFRFISTRLVFALARQREHNDPWMNEIVVGAEKVVPEEIWKVTTQREAKPQSFYVLFATGEVIGHAPPWMCNLGITAGQRITRGPRSEVFDKPRDKALLRTDWTKYIESVERGDAPSLQDAIKSADQESYAAGISTFWLRGPGGKDSVLKMIAKRYVLSCVEPNSLSGSYKSVIGMARELVGGGIVTPVPMKSQRIGLLISEHHLVESVDLEHQQPRPNVRLHPALALILTSPGREYFALRDTGMPIGTSDEGLQEVWQEVIGCDARGCVSA